MIGGRLLLAILGSLVVSSVARAQAMAGPQCAAILPPAVPTSGTRPLMAEDLVRLRDIGPAEPQNFPDPLFTISPDGRWAAFQLRRADPANNRYCLAMVVLDLSRKAAPRIVDQGGDPLLFTLDLRGAEIPLGLLRVITPRWSGDGQSIFFLKRVGGTTQVWRANRDGSGSTQFTHSAIDVADFRIGKDGSSIIFVTLPGIEKERAENERQSLNGWHYDDRFAPWISKWPLPQVSSEREVRVLERATGKVRTATAEEIATITNEQRFADPAPASDASGLSVSRTDIFGRAQPRSLHARLRDGSTASCTAYACGGAMHSWWMPGKTHVRFMRAEGWARASTAVYDWNLRSGDVRRLYRTDDLLTSCTPQGRSLICLMDSSLVPGQLVRLDPASGKRRILFDLNPEFAHLTLGRPIRLHWRNALGIETVGDLVLPVGYRPGARYPMVIVQYDTRGFLRGGTDEEYPIQAFANRGYAVLSFKRPEIFAEFRGATTLDEVGRIDLDGFADRRSVESSLEGGVRLAVERGIADPSRIGITGLSDGASTVEWALIHTNLFAAAAVSSCCWDPMFEANVGPSAARHFHAEGWPGVLEASDPFWKEVSLFANARRIRTPILASAADEELLSATLAYTGLREAGVPIDLFVYPNEYHARWQPAHRLAIYRRSLDWFDYWLRGVRSSAPDRQSELREWDRLRAEGGHGHPV